MDNSMVMDLQFVGHNYFNSKDKTKIYYILQFLICSQNVTNTILKTGVTNVFVDEKQYKDFVNNKQIGQKYQVKISIDLLNDRIKKEVL